jgi:hypothetical protein
VEEEYAGVGLFFVSLDGMGRRMYVTHMIYNSD